MFVDKIKISVKSGDGGDGAVSFHREKYIPKGGPNGGDGGRGGDIIIRASKDENTLIAFRYTRKFNAQSGARGMGANKTGSDGEDVIITVPVGTVIKSADGENVYADMFEDGESIILQRGGRGGKGNARFATPTRQAPRFSTPGQKTEKTDLMLELKTIADIGIVGMPNVGKSTLLSVLTSARPKIANYHFTTLSPNLGVATHNGYSFVLADIPGLIEGAAEGAGLGHDFLRHVERTRMLIHIVDISGIEGRDPYEDYCTINKELFDYSQRLKDVKQLVVANKTDLGDCSQALERFEMLADVKVFPISAVTVKGLDALLNEAVALLKQLPPAIRFEVDANLDYAKLKEGFEVQKTDGAYCVDGRTVAMILGRTQADDLDSMRHFHKLMVDTGIIKALREAGATEGDTIIMGEWEFDFVE